MTFALAALIVSCSDNEEAAPQQMNDLGTALGAGLQKSLTIDFERPVTFSYDSDEQKQLIINDFIAEIYEVELQGYTENGIEYSEELSFVININENLRIITIKPELRPGVFPILTTNGDEDCGSGEGWKLYATCMSEPCVKEKSEEAGEDLSKKLSPGKCLDIRVKRNTFNAKVCGRVIPC